jgi:hypothetical protein
MSDIEESLKRITSHNGVMGVAVLDDAGKLARCATRRGWQRAARRGARQLLARTARWRWHQCIASIGASG